VLQRDLLYKAPEFSKHDYAVKLIENEGETLRVAVLNEGKKEAIIYFGGNSEWVLSTAKRREKQFSNYTVYLVNYRGYGGSTGETTEKGLYSDALVIYDTLKKEHKDIHLLGRSLGSGVASYVAGKREIEKLALVTPYDSVLNVAQGKYPMYPLAFMLKDKLDSVENLVNVKNTKILILMAEDDKVIPNEHSYALAKSIDKEQVKVEVIKGESHSSISHEQRYFDILNGFFE
jgi:pimeloyl-ACP methyl ester carboxylesterase